MPSSPDIEFNRNISSSSYPNIVHPTATLISDNIGTRVPFLANTLYSSPILVTRATKINRIGCNMTAANLNLRLGIYPATSQSNLKPAAKYFDAGTVNANTADGLGNVFISVSPSVPISAGFYWITTIADTNCSIRGASTDPGVGVDAWTWQSLGNNMFVFSQGASWVGWAIGPQSYAGGLPATYPTNPTKAFIVPVFFLGVSC